MYNVECPYCGEEFDVEYEDDESWNEECPHCGLEMEIIVELEPTFEARGIYFETCSVCGKECRDTEMCSMNGKEMCYSCYCNKLFKDTRKEK